VGELNDASLKEFLLETAWFSLKAPAFRSDVRATQRNRIVRANAKLLDSQLPAGLKWVKKYTSSANYPTESLKVSNPLVDGEPQTGTWALVGARIEWVEELARARIGKLCLVEELARITTLTTGSESGKSLTRATELAALGFWVKVAREPHPWDRVDLIVRIDGIDPASRTLLEQDAEAGVLAADILSALNAVAPTNSFAGYTIMGRECVPEDDGATLSFQVGLVKSQTWTADKEQVAIKGVAGYRDYGQSRRVEGLSWAQATADLAAATAGTGFGFAHVGLRPMGDGRWALETDEVAIYTGTNDEHAVVMKWKSGKSSGKALLRIWYRRSVTAKNTLVGASGKAQTDYSYTWPGDESPTTFKHLECWIEDEPGPAYTVYQYLAENVIVGGVVPFGDDYSVNFPVKKVYTRATDNETKTVEYTKFVAQFTTDSAAWEWIEDFGDSPPEGWTGYSIVVDTPNVAKHGEYAFLATFLALHPSNIGNWTT
jgi:hypothetical protein